MDNRQKLLVSDLDGTLLGDDDALRRFAEGWKQFSAEAKLVYSSGRLYESICRSIRETNLPDPDLVICGVGTEIRDFTTGRVWSEWPRQFEEWNAERVLQRLAGRSDLEVQPIEFLSPWKVSYFARDWSTEAIEELHQQLISDGICCRIIYSSARDLDILPQAAGKGNAALFVADQLRIPLQNLIGAGDSGNDLCLLQSSGRSIVVANAQSEVRRLNQPTVFHSSRPFAGGVMEGLTHWWGWAW